MLLYILVAQAYSTGCLRATYRPEATSEWPSIHKYVLSVLYFIWLVQASSNIVKKYKLL